MRVAQQFWTSEPFVNHSTPMCDFLKTLAPDVIIEHVCRSHFRVTHPFGPRQIGMPLGRRRVVCDSQTLMRGIRFGTTPKLFGFMMSKGGLREAFVLRGFSLFLVPYRSSSTPNL